MPLTLNVEGLAGDHVEATCQGMTDEHKIGLTVLDVIARLERRDADERMMDPEGAFPFRRPDQRKEDWAALETLRELRDHALKVKQ